MYSHLFRLIILPASKRIENAMQKHEHFNFWIIFSIGIHLSTSTTALQGGTYQLKLETALHETPLFCVKEMFVYAYKDVS